MKTVTFELTTNIKYNPGSGQEIEVNFIELREPTGKVSVNCCAIESLIQSGLINMANVLGDSVPTEKEDKTDEGEITDPDSMMSVISSANIDMKKLVVNFRELFKKVAFMGGEKQITDARLDNMSHHDFKAMMGVYTVNFIMN